MLLFFSTCCLQYFLSSSLLWGLTFYLQATTKLLVRQAISQLRTVSSALTVIRAEMLSLAASLPEYPIVMKMFDVGNTLGPHLIAEIGDVRRFYSKKALVAFAGIDAPPY